MSAISENSGFFPDYYDRVRTSVSPNDFNALGLLKTDLERVRHVVKTKGFTENQLEIKREFPGKSEENAVKLKQFGNEAFRMKKWPEALMLYSKSYISMPGDKESDVSVLLANRSAALFHMNRYNESLADIKRAIQKGYPKDLVYKLFERRAQCHLANKKYVDAVEAFKNTITALDDSKLPLDKRSQIERNAMIMIKTLEREQLQKLQKAKPSSSSSSGSSKPKEVLSDAVEIDENVREGRFAKASKNIQVGDQILIERPYACGLLEKFCKTHCQNCMKRTIIPIACPNCADVIFCSDACSKEANSSYHKFECGILSTIWRSGVSINCQLALRMITIKDSGYFLDNFDQFKENLSTDELKKLPSSDYRRVFSLVRHANKRSETSFFQYALMSCFLTECLIAGGYFKADVTADQKEKMASLIMNNLQILQYNTHEIFELHKSSKTGEATKTVFVGGGIYPTLALFNHSCDPGIVKFYDGTAVHVHAIKPLKPGDVIAENYGPLYTQESREERREKLLELYQFECDCQACAEVWPRFDQMQNDVLRVRCDADRKCPNIIEIPLDCNDFMVQCIQCGQLTNILKALKVMQDSVAIDKTAKRLYDSGDVQKALEKYIDKLKIMHEVVAPPFTDYSQCQQNIKDCFLHFGNSYFSSE